MVTMTGIALSPLPPDEGDTQAVRFGKFKSPQSEVVSSWEVANGDVMLTATPPNRSASNVTATAVVALEVA